MTRLMRHSLGMEKKVKVGFSWTTLFFGVFVPIIRGHWSYVVKMFLLCWLTFGIYALVAPFVINKQYTEYLLMQGYQFVD